MQEGERFGFRIETARTYMEIGKRLLEGKSRFKKDGDTKAKKYLEKARTVFQEIKLHRDIDELDKIVAL